MGRIEAVQKTSGNIRAASFLQIAITEAQKQGQTPAQAAGTIGKQFHALGLPYGKTWDANEASLKKYIETLNAHVQKHNADLQTAIDKRNQAFQMMSDLNKKMNDSQMKIISSMK